MIKVPVYNMAGEQIAEIEVDEARLGKVSKDAMRQAILTHEANWRAGTAKTKTMGEVAFSDRKPWPQKHTGRARAGSRASSIWVGGGKTFGPVPRDHSKKINRKMRRRAVASALLCKLQDGAVKVLDVLELTQPKTREVARVIKNIGVERTFILALPEHDPTILRCTRNIPGATVSSVRELNTYEILKAWSVVFTRKAFEQMLEAYEEKADAAEAQPPQTGEDK